MTAPIPAYPATRPLELADRELLQDRLRMLQPKVSELSFANLFLFRHAHTYTLTSHNASLIIFGCTYDDQSYFLPPLSGNRGETSRLLLDAGNMLYGADEEFLVQHLAGTAYPVIADPDNADYLHLRSELAELPGARFHKKRNRIQHFVSQHGFRVLPFAGEYRASALQLLDTWQSVHGDGRHRSRQAEAAATREGLERAEELGLSGVVVLTAKGVSAFALGEQLNETTTVCHFEKADPELEGLAQLVNREFCRHQPTACRYINREQDLGEQGLREAKRSYHPIAMVQKFRVMPAQSPLSHTR